ncbi:MAG: TIGR02099 family protein [Rhodanobacter denitrificans]|uniref:TIGR02099 family protein n=1 Tax=Rhodanobacter denitrificans TaxID=666685 RepID=A0A2W5KVH1_9GAMM|nr:MAG: TIGR02099 family protein [Rhodanobacter denitrificans]
MGAIAPPAVDPARRRWRRVRRIVAGTLATIVIALGVLVGIGQLVVPWLVRNPDRVEAWLAERIDRPVTIGHIAARWVRGGPQLVLENVLIGARAPEQTPLRLQRAELALNVFAPFQRNRAWNEFRLVGLDLSLERDADGRWQLHGFDLDPAASGDPLGALGVLVLVDLKLRLDDERHGVHLQVGASELRVVNRGAELYVLGKVRSLDEEASALDLITSIRRGEGRGRLYLSGRDVDLGRLLRGQAYGGTRLDAGRGLVQAWAEWDHGRVLDVRTRLDLRGLRLAVDTPGATTAPMPTGSGAAMLDRLALALRWRRGGGEAWSLDLADVVFGAGGIEHPPMRASVETLGTAPLRWRAAADTVALAPLGGLAAQIGKLPAGLRTWLRDAIPRGRLDQAYLRYDGAEDYELSARFSDLAIAPAAKAPGLGPLHGELRGDAQAVLIALPEQGFTAEYPGVFREPFVFSTFGGDVVLRPIDDGWRVETERIVFEGDGYGGELRGGVELPRGRPRPRLDLYAAVAHGDVAAAKRFWPVNVMPRPAVEWLDRALQAGRVVDGRAVIRGDLAEWPFDGYGGRFEAVATIEDTQLQYLADWPRVEGISAVARFVNDGMEASASAGNSLGAALGGAEARIADFGDAMLELSATGRGSGRNLLGFVRATPIGTRFRDALAGLAIGGNADFDFKLQVPLKKDAHGFSLDGTATLAGATVTQPDWRVDFSDVAGAIRFDRGGFVADKLHATTRGHAGTLTVAVGDAVTEAGQIVQARLDARLPAQVVFADVPGLESVLAHMDGSSQWTIAASVAGSDHGAPGRTRLSAHSDLVGTAIDLPAPLAKAADVALPLDVALPMPYAGGELRVTLGDVMTVSGRLPAPDAPLAMRLDFGTKVAGALPDRGFVIGGRAPLLDLGGWASFVGASSGAGDGDFELRGADLAVDALMLGTRPIGAAGLRIARSAAATEFSFTGDALQGGITLPTADLMRAGVTVHLDRLHWPESPEDDDVDAPAAGSDLTPGLLPPLHIWIGDLRIGRSVLGQTRFESRPVAGGMRIDQLDAKSPNLEMHAQGDWSGTPGANRSRLSIDLSSHDLGRMLDAFGYAGIIDGGRTTARIEAGWAGPPTGFALAKLDGTLAITVGSGRILDVEPGAGRIFGLLSLTEIPRRLSLDFSDFFRSGFSFNAISGTFRLSTGQAATDDLSIKGPAADIRVSGRTDLRNKNYDQRLVVTPHAGATLPVVGALAGGPVGAAAGLVVQGLFNKQINAVARATYEVTGPWDKPQIRLVSRESRADRAGRDESEPAR